ncbi:MAG: hypothetical protein IT229_07885 [Flavobacteriales bacterium]|nr:hypothetical protein [Flavobacteriales bacterium]
MRTFFRRTLFALCLLVSVLLAWTNLAVHQAPPTGSDDERMALVAQLRYLEGRVHAGLGEEMQQLFPEGSAFTHALYGLAWCGLVQGSETDDTLREHAAREARWALKQLDRPEEQGRFPVSAEPKFGVFYCGWRNLLLGSILELGAADTVELIAFDRNSAALSDAFARSGSPYLESYVGMAWPADATVAMASLALHQRLRGGAHQQVIDRWVAQVHDHLDANGSMPHAWDPYHDRSLTDARGSSQGLINTFLPEINEALAHEQFGRFRDAFFMERLGVPAVSEYPQGTFGWGDVDSGPLILGAGPAATIVGSAACRVNGDEFHAQEFAASVHGFGFVIGGERKRYLFGALPIADLFIAWGRSMPSAQATESPGFKRFHLWSVLALVVMWGPWWFVFRRLKIVKT